MITLESFGIVPFCKENGEHKVLLILHLEGNHWGFPKGKANPSETPLETAKRELKEETGLDILEIFNQEPLVEQYTFRRKRDVVQKTVRYFAASVEGSLQLQAEEIRDAKWLSFDEALKQLSFKEARHILRQCIRMIPPEAT